MSHQPNTVPINVPINAVLILFLLLGLFCLCSTEVESWEVDTPSISLLFVKLDGKIGKGGFWDSYDHFSAIANLGHRNICNM